MWGILVALLSGALMSLQGIFNTEVTKQSSIWAAAGKAKMLDASFLKEGAVLIDVGINVDENGKLCGDVLWEGLEEKASAATPVPGGVGAVTTAVLAKHLAMAAERKVNR